MVHKVLSNEDLSKLEGTKTYENLQKAFQREALAIAKYNIYADVAKDDGYQGIKDIFLQTVKNETAHAEIWFKILHGDDLPHTLDNLEDATSGEDYEYEDFYPNFADIAEEEGFIEISNLFREVADVEKSHHQRYDIVIDNIKEDKIFKKDEDIIWECSNCGHLEYGLEAPLKCPVCGHPRAYFIRKVDNYV